MFAVKNRKIFYGISVVSLIASLIFVFSLGLHPGIDFTGGSMLEINYPEGKPQVADISSQKMIENVVKEAGFSGITVRASGENGFFIKMPTIDDATKTQIKESLTFDNTYVVEEKRFNTVGPSLGNELKTKATVAILLVLLAIIFYVAYVFRSVSKPVSSWKYGFVTIIALVHDIIITLGVFALMGHFIGTEIDTLFVTALLVILGYSVNDSIIALDRVRENLTDIDEKQREVKFAEIVGRSIKDTISRSVNTSLTTLLALVALFIFGGETTKDFALALIVGIIAGGYSSVFLAAPMLVTFKDWQDKKKKSI